MEKVDTNTWQQFLKTLIGWNHCSQVRRVSSPGSVCQAEDAPRQVLQIGQGTAPELWPAQQPWCPPPRLSQFSSSCFMDPVSSYINIFCWSLEDVNDMQDNSSLISGWLWSIVTHFSNIRSLVCCSVLLSGAAICNSSQAVSMVATDPAAARNTCCVGFENYCSCICCINPIFREIIQDS